jgi:hypothetical protein
MLGKIVRKSESDVVLDSDLGTRTKNDVGVFSGLEANERAVMPGIKYDRERELFGSYHAVSVRYSSPRHVDSRRQ